MMRMEEDSVAEGLPGGKVIQRRRTVSWESYSRQLHKVVSQINSRRYCFVRVIICFNSYGMIPTLLVESLYFPENLLPLLFCNLIAIPPLWVLIHILCCFIFCEWNSSICKIFQLFRFDTFITRIYCWRFKQNPVFH